MADIKQDSTKRYLVTFEFRYHIVPTYEPYERESETKKVTIGVYDSFEEACEKGNNHLIYLESLYKLNPNWNVKERFSKRGGCFGSPKTLISNLAYLQTPFTFYGKIITLDMSPFTDVLSSVINKTNRYQQFKLDNKDDH